jgi:integrase/recombinase XerD
VTDELLALPLRRCLLVTDWPGPDRAAWATAHRRGSLLDEDGGAADWAPVTSNLIAAGYGRFLSFLVQTGDLHLGESPATRISRARVESYVTELRRIGNHSSTVAARLLQLVRAAAVMAPGADWAWLRRIQARLKRMATPARDDRARLLPVEKLFDLAILLMQRAETTTDMPGHRRALLYRDGLIIAVLCAWAPRARNIAETVIDISMQRRGTAWWAAFKADGTKNKRPFEVPLPNEFTVWIERYLDQYRPWLVQRSTMPVAGDAFWISDGGRPLTAKGIGELVSRTTRRELGQSLNAHLFRKAIPTELAIRDPEHVGIAQPLLGHADYRTTQQAYNLARALDAARRYNSLIQSIRDEEGKI